MRINDLIKGLEYCRDNIGNVEVGIRNLEDDSLLQATAIVNYEDDCILIGAISK